MGGMGCSGLHDSYMWDGIAKEEKKKDIIIHVGGKCPDLPQGEVWQPVYVMGLRMLLYDVPSAVSVCAAPQSKIQTWSVDVVKVDHALTDAGMLNHIQVDRKKAPKANQRDNQCATDYETLRHLAPSSVAILAQVSPRRPLCA